MKKHPTRPLPVLATALLTLAACGGGTELREPAAEPVVAVETAIAETRLVSDSFEASGLVEAHRRVSPGTKIMGRVERVDVRLADRVRRGQLLAKLEDRDLRAAVEQARAGIAMAEARQRNAAAQFARMTELEGRGSATRKNLEDATSAHELAQAELAKARADLAAAQAQLSYSEVRSPIDGWVVEKAIEPGDMAVPGRPFFAIEDLDRVKVALRVPEREVIGLAAGQPAEAQIDVLGETFAASIDRIVPAGDPASRTFTVELTLDNAAGRIKSGMFARARFSRGEREALLVPTSAVVRRGQLEGVFVVADGRAVLRWIKSAPSGTDHLEVLSGLEPGERYAPRPPLGLRDGSPVREAAGA